MSSILQSPPPDASSTKRGVVNTIAQTFAGLKTFVAGISLGGLLTLTKASSSNRLRLSHGIEWPDGSTTDVAGITGSGGANQITMWNSAGTSLVSDPYITVNSGIIRWTDVSETQKVRLGTYSGVGYVDNGYGFGVGVGEWMTTFAADSRTGLTPHKGWVFGRGGTDYGLVIRGDTNTVGIGGIHPAAGYTLDVNGKIRSRSGGVEFPDGTLQATAAASLYTREIELLRSVPGNNGDTIYLGSFAHTNGAGSFWIQIVFQAGGISVSKNYSFNYQYDGTANAWSLIRPVSATGPFSGHDFDLDISHPLPHQARLRIRNIGGGDGRSGDARVSIRWVTSAPSTSDTFTDESTIEFGQATPATVFSGGPQTANGSGATSRMPYWSSASNLTYASSILADGGGLRFGIDGSSSIGWIGFGINGSNAALKIGDLGLNGFGFSAPAGIFYSDNFSTGHLGWGFIDGGSGHQLFIIRADSQSVGVGLHPAAGYKLDVDGKIRSRSGGVELPDGKVLASAADVASAVRSLPWLGGLESERARVVYWPGPGGLPGGGVISQGGDPGFTGATSITADANGRKRAGWKITSAATSGVTAYVYTTNPLTSWELQTDWSGMVRGPDVLTSVRWFSGMTFDNIGMVVSDTPAASGRAVSYIGFRFSSVASGGFLECGFGNGTADTWVSTGIALTANRVMALAVKFVAGQIKFYVDGVVVASPSMTNAPTTRTNIDLYGGCAISPLSNAARAMEWYGFAFDVQ